MGVPQHAIDIIAAGAARIAVVGASNNPEKYGNVIVRTLSSRGFTVLPVHPADPQVCGIPAFANLDMVPGAVDVVNFVTPPAVTSSILAAMDPGRFPVVWFQDGACDDACLDLARAKFGTVVHGACIMVATRTFGPAAPAGG